MTHSTIDYDETVRVLENIIYRRMVMSPARQHLTMEDVECAAESTARTA